MLFDAYGRIATKLRVSVTDRCNFKCFYCMPSDPVWMARSEILSLEEITRLISVFAGLGVKSVRLTGGEPLVRRNIEALVTQVKNISGITEVNLTTNGYYLVEKGRALADAGLDRINISIDSLDRTKFEQIVRRANVYDRVMEGIKNCQNLGLKKVRLNSVVVRGFNDDEINEMLEFGRSLGYEVRFIEFMPLEGDGVWSREKVVTESEILSAIASRYSFSGLCDEANSPSNRYRLHDGYVFGVIPSVSNPFCRSCNRLRLTADGRLRTCLFAVDETDLKTPMRSGASDQELGEIIKNAVYRKWEGHLINSPEFKRPGRSMFQIGG